MPILSEIKGRVPVKIWSPLIEIESDALTQLRNTTFIPHVFHHVAAMADIHVGKGATIGSVVAMKGAVAPCLVGVDIGCGMMALKLNIEPGRILDKLSEIRSEIEAAVPVGFNSNENSSSNVDEWIGWKEFDKLNGVKPRDYRRKAMNQLGTLGSGNHFIEVCLDENGAVWVMLHSGSRNIGKELAESHIGVAKGLLKQYAENFLDPDLAYFVQGTDEFTNYLSDLQWAQSYARQNREEMMERILAVITKKLGLTKTIDVDYRVNCHHNYVANEVHFGEAVLVTRKGAVRAGKGDLGIIPGSMGTRSYIVEGLGNPESFESCSHGAGRRMSRGKAKKMFTVADLIKQTEGVECRKDEGILDEAPLAYKDIDKVMENQSDLVKVVATLKQVMCIKG